MKRRNAAAAKFPHCPNFPKQKRIKGQSWCSTNQSATLNTGRWGRGAEPSVDTKPTSPTSFTSLIKDVGSHNADVRRPTGFNLTPIRFDLRYLFLATAIAAVASVIYIAVAPRNLRAEAEQISKSSTTVERSRVPGDYACGIRGSLYQLSLSSDGTYDVVENGCLGMNGTATGIWRVNGNIIDFAPLNGSGSVFSNLSWALVSEEEGCVILNSNNLIELYLDNGYWAGWSFTRTGDAAKILAAKDRRTKRCNEAAEPN